MTMPKRYIDADEFEKRIKPYDTNDPVDKALYNFAHNKMLDTSTADVVERKDIEAECELAYKHGWSDCFAEHRWIPVTERLPKDERYVLVTTVSGDVTEAKYWQKERFWVLKGLAIMSVTAWMPLPKPYRKETEDETANL